jgi:hypothetical protein
MKYIMLTVGLLSCTSILKAATFTEANNTIKTQREALTKEQAEIKKMLQGVDTMVTPLKKKHLEALDKIKKKKSQAQQIKEQKAALEERTAMLKKALDDLESSNKEATKKTKSIENQVNKTLADARVALTKKNADLQAMLVKMQNAVTLANTMYLNSTEKEALAQTTTQAKSTMLEVTSMGTSIDKKLADLAVPVSSGP